MNVSPNKESRPGASSHDRIGARPAPIKGKDVYLLGYLASMTFLSWCVPERYWQSVAFSIEWLQWRVQRQPNRDKRRWLERTARLIGEAPVDASAEEILRGSSAHKHLATLQLLRCHRPGGWRPDIRLDGENHLRHALDTGRGAILWVQPTAAGDLVTKMACHRAGFRVSHLSRYSHGFSDTRFGYRVLNPVRIVVERRFLAERLVMGPEGPFVHGKDGPVRAVEALAQRLAAGGVISITVVAAQARRPRHMPFLNGWLPVGDGAIRLARRTGAALFPVFTVQEADGAFTTTIEPALDVPVTGDDDGATEEVLGAYGRVLERHLLRAPEQFSVWYHAVKSPGAHRKV